MEDERRPAPDESGRNGNTADSDPQAEIIGVIDADYIVQPDYLRRIVPYFADPEIAFVLVGCPIPRRVGEEPSEVHWQPLYLRNSRTEHREAPTISTWPSLVPPTAWVWCTLGPFRSPFARSDG